MFLHKKQLLQIHHRLGHTVTYLEKKLQLLAGIFLVLMVLVSVVNIVGRNIGLPITGTVELVGLFSALVISASLALTQSRGEHIAVNIVTEHFPLKLQKAFAILNATLCAFFFGWVAKTLFTLATVLCKKGEITETLFLPIWPFVGFCALGMLCLALSLVVQIGGCFYAQQKY